MSEQEVQLFSEQQITAFDPFRAQLAELKEGNEKAVFDYADPKGNKNARSHIYKLRQTKTAVDKVRKLRKDDSLQFGRRVDAQAKEISAEIDQMIEIHSAPLKAIEEKEATRVAKHEKCMAELQALLDEPYSEWSASDLKTQFSNINGIEPDERFEEFTAPALSIWKTTKAKIEAALEDRIKYDAEQAELQRLRAEKDEREQKERDDKIAREAAENARIEAENKARIEVDAAAKREADAKAATEYAEQQKLETERKAKRDAEEAEKRRVADIAATEARVKREAGDAKLADEKAAKAREANKKHKAIVNNEILDALLDIGVTMEHGKKIITSICKGKIPNVSISY